MTGPGTGWYDRGETGVGAVLDERDLQVLAQMFGQFKGELKTVDVNIRRLRIKIESDPTEPEYLTTVWGYGYKWGY